MALVSFRIPDDLAGRFSALAATEGGRSAALRGLIEKALGEQPSRPAALPMGAPTKVTVRFRKSEMQHLATAASQRGMSRTQWIVSLVRTRLGSPVQLTEGERQELRAIARELNRIGGNINQIARAVNASRSDSKALKIDRAAINDAKATLEAVLAELRQALDRNKDYWEGRS